MPAPQAFEIEATRRAQNFVQGKTYAIALTNVAPDPENDAILADLTEIDYTNLSARTLMIDALPARVGDVQGVTAQNLLLTASGGDVGPFRYAVVYEVNGSDNPLKFFVDYNVEYTIIDESSFEFRIPGNFVSFSA